MKSAITLLIAIFLVKNTIAQIQVKGMDNYPITFDTWTYTQAYVAETDEYYFTINRIDYGYIELSDVHYIMLEFTRILEANGITIHELETEGFSLSGKERYNEKDILNSVNNKNNEVHWRYIKNDVRFNLVVMKDFLVINVSPEAKFH